MADLIRGLKAGILSGIIWGILNAIISSFIFAIMIKSYSYFNPIMGLLSLPFGIISGIIVGVILGLIYSAGYNILPGSSSIIKGISLMLILWVIFSVVIGNIFSLQYNETFTNYYEMNLISSLITYIIFGYLIGLLWDKYKSRIGSCIYCNRNIPTDSKLCPYCGKNVGDVID